MEQFSATLWLGFVLGLKHALEADHVIAVSTMVTEQKNPLKAATVGTFWGIGHTSILLVIGIIVLLLKVNISAELSSALELLVALMLVLLGLRAIIKSRESVHDHTHEHDHRAHSHLHMTHAHMHHQRSFIIGAIHGLAGSGVLMILVLATVKSLLEGIYYILLFGIGSVASMTLMSLLIGVPFIYSTGKYSHAERYIRIFSGVLSVAYGLYLGYVLILESPLLHP